MEQQPELPKPTLTPTFILRRNFPSSNQNPRRLIKIAKRQHQLFAGYEDGYMAVFDLNHKRLSRTMPLYKSAPVVDFCLFEKRMASCTHTEVTVHDLETNKYVNLKGHQSTPLFVAVHPICPLVLSCSNLLLLHDLRIGKPINVQFITPPAFGLEFFPDGQFFLLSGEPCRIGNTRWVRTLMNGMGRVSPTGKHILTNDMSGRICLWDWRDSTEMLTLDKIANQEVYQPIYFGLRNSKPRDILFLEETGDLLRYGILEEKMRRDRLPPMDNGKLYVDGSADDTKEAFRFGHDGFIEHYHLKE